MKIALTIAAALIALGAAAAFAQIPNSNAPMLPYFAPLGPMQSGGLGGPMIPGTVTNAAPPISGKLLLADGSSFLLQTDGTSKICLSGGC